MNAILAQTAPDLHTSVQQFWIYGIAIVTPLIIAGAKKVIPTLPKLLLPIVSPFVGMALGFALNAITNANLGWVDSAMLGGLGVTIREIVDQAVKAAKRSS